MLIFLIFVSVISGKALRFTDVYRAGDVGFVRALGFRAPFNN